MTKEELISAIRKLTDYSGVRLGDIEKTLGISKNMLSGMLNGTRPFAPKWQVSLEAYLKAKLAGREEIIIPIKDSKIRAQNPPKKAPKGLTKAQKTRWLRENNQTLR